MNTLTSRFFLPAAITFAGVAFAGALYALRPQAARAPAEEVRTLVSLVEARPHHAHAKVDATGVVSPARQVSLAPEVSGALVEVSDEAVPGGRFEKGALIARVDPRAYRLAVTSAEATVRKAELDLEVERSRHAAAAREWALLGEGRPAEEAPLALREPQLATAEVAVAAARAALDKAKLDLERTAIRAPWNAVVTTENLEVGQIVGPSAPVIALIGTDQARVEVSLPVDRLPLLEIPGLTGETGSAATIAQTLGDGGVVERRGAVHRLVGQLDPASRTATVLVLVEDPMGEGSGLPLLPGAFVNLRFDGADREQVVEIPRVALHGGDTVWVAGADDRLARRTVALAWGEQDVVYVRAGLEPGDRVVVSSLSLPIEGMAVRTEAQPPSAGSAGAEE